MKVKVTVTLTLDSDVDDIGRSVLRDYIKRAVLTMKGSSVPEDPINRYLADANVSGVIVVRDKHERHVHAGLERAKSLSPQRRREIAQNAAKARWAKQ